MKTSLLKLAGSLIAALALTSAAIATPIAGKIFITWNAGAFATVHDGMVDFPAGPNSTVDFGTGDYAGNIGASVNFYDVTYSPQTPGLLWELTSLITTNFWIQGFDGAIVGPFGGGIISGWGVAHMAGKDATYGQWTLAATNTGGQFSWVATTIVPDGGLTAAMLGLGLLGLGFVARRQKRA